MTTATPPDGPSRSRHLQTFCSVAGERLSRLNLLWIQIEQDLAGAGALNEFLRELHTLKGEASLMGFSQIVAIVHALEDLLRPQAEGAPADATTGDLVLRGLDMVSAAVEGAVDAQDQIVAAFLTDTRRSSQGLQPDPLPSKRSPVRAAQDSPPPAPASRADSIRVTAAKLDRVRDTIGELMLTQARLALAATEFRKAREVTQEYAEQLETTAGPAAKVLRMLVDAIVGLEARLREDSHRAVDLVTELDGATRELRMIPIRTLFEQYPVAIRELGRELGRTVLVEFEGETVEVDRSVLDRLSEPLLHLLRNAVDHGIEDAERRRQAGKRAEGAVKVRAALQGRMLEVTVADDGAGIDVEAVRARAIELGLVDAAQASLLSEEQVLRTIFQARMSTRRQVTQVSGRGLGLNVVLKTVEGLGGTVAVRSALGHGTAFHLSMPVTLAMTSVVLFGVGSARYAVPAAAVVALVDEAAYPAIASIDGPSIRYAEALIPLLHVDKMLGETAAPSRSEVDEVPRLMIVSRGREQLALAGTHHHSEREVVLKSMGKIFPRNRLISAVVPLADGTLALVLSLSELLQRAQAIPGAPTAAVTKRRQTVLVVDDSPVVRDLLAEALRAHGLQVIEASDGEDALLKMEAGPSIDLLVSDIDMPKLDGIGLLRRVRKRDGARRIPVVIVSMRGSSEDQRRALDAGADAYLVKTDLSHAGLWTMLARFLG